MGLRSKLGGLVDRTGLAWFRRFSASHKQADSPFSLPELIEKPDGSRAMVLAPHADDETLGCGGTLYKHHLAGDRITVVFLTDGSQGYAMAENLRGRDLVEMREREAQTAAGILGIGECIFLRNPDTALEASPAVVAQLEYQLESLHPDVVYVPSPMDTHRDHRQTCAIAAQALAGYAGALQVYLYETWSPIPANCAVVIDLDRKIQAIRAYRTQMDSRQLYVTAATSLAHYRGATCLPGQALSMECFLRLDRAAFCDLAGNVA